MSVAGIMLSAARLDSVPLSYGSSIRVVCVLSFLNSSCAFLTSIAHQENQNSFFSKMVFVNCQVNNFFELVMCNYAYVIAWFMGNDLSSIFTTIAVIYFVFKVVVAPCVNRARSKKQARRPTRRASSAGVYDNSDPSEEDDGPGQSDTYATR